MHVHPLNRDGLGLSAPECHALLNEIVDVGWDWSQPNPICVEIVSEEDLKNITDLNVALAKDSQEPNALAEVVPGTVKYASLSASHTNQMLRLFQAGALHTGSENLMINGRLSMDLLKHVDAEFHDAAKAGLQWRVLSASVLSQFPQVASLIQEACNVGAHLQRRESELQMARRLHSVWKHMRLTTERVEYKDIQARILRSKPSRAPSVPSIYLFLLKFGGGGPPVALLESEKFVKACGPGASQKMLGPQVWEALAMDSKGGHSYLRIRHALLRIGFMDGITLQECKKVLGGSMSEKVIEAEDLCTEIRALCQKHAVSPEAMREVLLFEHEIIKVLLDKKGHAESVQHCAHDLVVRVKQVDGREITNKWNTFVPSDTSTPSAIPSKSCHNTQILGCLLSYAYMYVYVVSLVHL